MDSSIDLAARMADLTTSLGSDVLVTPSSTESNPTSKPRRSPARLRDLPNELHEAIARACNRGTKANLRLVNHFYFQIVTPILYESVALFINHQYAISQDFKHTTMTICRRDRAPFVKRLNIRCEPPDDETKKRRKGFVDMICQILMTPLSQMTALEHFEFDADTTIISEELHLALSQIPSLKSLEIRVGPRKIKDERYNTTKKSYESLARVTLYDMSLETYECIAKVRLSAFKLKSLRLGSTWQKRWAYRHRDPEVIAILWDYIFGTVAALEAFPMKLPIPALEELVLFEFPLPAVECPAEKKSSEGFKHLKKLQLLSCYQSDVAKKDFFEAFAEYFTSLEELNIGGVRPTENSFGVLHLLNKSPPLKKLGLFLWNMDIEKTIDAVCSCGKTLEYLVLEGDYFSLGGIQSELPVKAVEKLADACPNLKEVSLAGYVDEESALAIAKIFASKLPNLTAFRLLGLNIPKWSDAMAEWDRPPIQYQLDTHNLANDPDSDDDELRSAALSGQKRKYILKKKKKKVKAKQLLREERQQPIQAAISVILKLFHDVGHYNIKYIGLNAIVARVWAEKNQIVAFGAREANEFCADETCKTADCSGPMSRVAMRTWIFNAFRKVHVERSEELAGGSYKL